MTKKVLFWSMTLSAISTPILASSGSNKIILSKKEENTLDCVKDQILNSKSVDKEFDNFTLNDWKQRPKQNRFVIQKALEKLYRNECSDINAALDRSIRELKSKVTKKSGRNEYAEIINENQVKDDSYNIISDYHLDEAVLGKRVTKLPDNDYSSKNNENDDKYKQNTETKTRKYSKDYGLDKTSLGRNSILEDSEMRDTDQKESSNSFGRDTHTKEFSSDLKNSKEKYWNDKSSSAIEQQNDNLMSKHEMSNNSENYKKLRSSQYASFIKRGNKDIQNKDNQQSPIETQNIYKDSKKQYNYQNDALLGNDLYQNEYNEKKSSLSNTKNTSLYSNKSSNLTDITSKSNEDTKYNNESGYKTNKKSNEQLNAQLEIINNNLEKASIHEGWNKKSK